MTCYEPPPPRTPNWLFRLAHMTLAAAMLAGIIAAMFCAAFLLHAIVVAL